MATPVLHKAHALRGATITKLTYVNLSDNSFDGELPNTIGNLTQLVTLKICCYIPCILGGPILLEISNLKSLIDLDLGGNKLSGKIPSSIYDLTNLVTIFLRSNFLTGSIDPRLRKLKYLTSLDLSNNNISGTVPPQFGDLSRLTF